jgi:HAD superfamily hydrolase (TIGR01509 family)
MFANGHMVCYNTLMHNSPLAIVFDCFGVMYHDAFLEFMAANQHRLQEPEAYYYALSDACDKGLQDPQVLYQAFSTVSGEPVAIIQARIDRNVASLNHDMVALIQELKHRYRVGLLSNISRDVLNEFLAADQVKHLFDQVVASSEVGFLKPSRQIFAAMADRLHIPFENWLFIDDRIKNVRGASRHGIPSYHFTGAQDLRSYLRHSGILVGPLAPVTVNAD